jgi:hypothetical protein
MTDQTTADQTALRDRIAEALMQWAEGNNSPKYTSMRRPETVVQNAYSRADAVLAVLPSSGCLTPEYTDGPCHCLSCDPAAHRTDRAAVSREAEAELYVLLRKAGEPRHEAQALIDRHRDEVLHRAELRRMADETATETPQRERVKHSGPDTKFCVLCLSGEHERVDESDAGATALRAAADFYERVLNESLDPDSDPRYCTAVRDIVMGLRRRADEPAAGARQDGACTNCRGSGLDPRHNGEFACPDCARGDAAARQDGGAQ